MNIVFVIAIFVILTTIIILIPRRYIVTTTDPETIAEALHERLKRDELKALILNLIMIMDAPRQEQ